MGAVCYVLMQSTRVSGYMTPILTRTIYFHAGERLNLVGHPASFGLVLHPVNELFRLHHDRCRVLRAGAQGYHAICSFPLFMSNFFWLLLQWATLWAR